MKLKPINNFEGYFVSDTGDIFSTRRNKNYYKLSQNNVTGYSRVSLCNNVKFITLSVHRLVAEHFLSSWNPAMEVNHIDGNKLNNCIENLEMVTPKENTQHSYKIGSRKRRLSDEDVIAIRSSRLSQRKLSLIYGVHNSIISTILSNKIYTHVRSFKDLS